MFKFTIDFLDASVNLKKQVIVGLNQSGKQKTIRTEIGDIEVFKSAFREAWNAIKNQAHDEANRSIKTLDEDQNGEVHIYVHGLKKSVR